VRFGFVTCLRHHDLNGAISSKKSGRIIEFGNSSARAMAYFTVSKQHNIKLREMAVRAGLKIDE
jgi:hypothetical protein